MKSSVSEQEWHWEPIDQQLAALLTDVRDQQPDDGLAIAIKLLSHQMRQGDICLQLSSYAGLVIESSRLPKLQTWLAILESNHAVGKPGSNKPLILSDTGKLYFQRYWQYEQQLIDELIRRSMTQIDKLVDCKDHVDTNRSLSEPQNHVVLQAANSAFSIITGGPGTGKTTTISGLIKILVKHDPTISIALAAPTGKAATRIQEAVADFDSHLAAQIQVSTVHRLLGFVPGRVEFQHNAANRLPHDIVIIDEASMIDLALMCKLVNSIKSQARLVLLGDADQLDSVESGAVFGELCRDIKNNRLGHCIHRLQYSYRFANYPGIGKLANAVNAGDHETAMQLLKSEHYPEISWRPLEKKSLEQFLTQSIANQFKLKIEPYQHVQSMGEFQLLCAHRKGQWGVDGLNQYIETWLSAHHLIAGNKPLYHGKPVIITRNDYQLNLFNGDLGRLVKTEAGILKALFVKSESELREISPSRLTAYQTAWALTVHQSQGSEFDHVILVMPEKASPVLSQALIYTAITQAKKSIQIISKNDILKQAISLRNSRQTGISDRLLCRY